MASGIRSITAMAETVGAASLPVSIDAIIAGMRERDRRGITYLLTPAAASPKLSHNGGHAHIVSAVQYLLPRTMGGAENLCAAADIGCAGSVVSTEIVDGKTVEIREGGCYVFGGRAAFDPGVNRSRKNKVTFRAEDKPRYLACLVAEILGIMADAATLEHGVPAVRLNGLSDIAWERVPVGTADNFMVAFPAVRFYDYTRVPGRITTYRAAGWPANYDLTFSLGADNDRLALRALDRGIKVAAVFRKPLAGAGAGATWHDFPTIDGDAHDFRFLESGPAIVALKAKGPAMKDSTGWVRENDSAGLDLSRTAAFIKSHMR